MQQRVIFSKCSCFMIFMALVFYLLDTFGSRSRYFCARCFFVFCIGRQGGLLIALWNSVKSGVRHPRYFRELTVLSCLMPVACLLECAFCSDMNVKAVTFGDFKELFRRDFLTGKEIQFGIIELQSPLLCLQFPLSLFFHFPFHALLLSFCVCFTRLLEKSQVKAERVKYLDGQD